MAKQNKHPIEEVLERLEEAVASAERNITINELLTDYIAFFHGEMGRLSENMAQKTNELFSKITELANQ